MMVCLDASVVGILITPDEQSPQVIDRYEKACLRGDTLIAPQLLPFEIASILRKKKLRQLLTAAEIVGALHFFHALRIQLRDAENLIERESLGPPLTVYDASYLVIAEKQTCELWTADKRFFRHISNNFSNLVLIEHK
jgi:predicted nucleic acid-binding protein